MGSSILTRSVSELRFLLRSGDVTSRDLVEESLATISALDSGINAFTSLRGDEAVNEAALIHPHDDRPLAGIPMAVKENRGVAGQPISQGSRSLLHARARTDDTVVARLKGAGAIIVGVTSMSEFGLLPGCEPAAHGATRNPLDRDLSTGGSSGGSAAAVAAGMVPMALGNDAGGSLRIPAAWCGLSTLVPSDRIGGSQDGVLARSWSDVVLGTDVIGGHERPRAGDADPGRGRFVVLTTPPGVDPGTDTSMGIDRDSLGIAIEALEEAGFRQQAIELPSALAGMRSFFPAVAPRVRATILRALGLDPLADHTQAEAFDLEPYTLSFLDHAGRVSIESQQRATAALDAWEREWRSLLGPDTVLVSPTTASIPPPLGQLTGLRRIEDSASALAEPTAFTWMANALGWQAAAVPVARDQAIPGSVQITAPRASAATLETASAIVASLVATRGVARRQDAPHG
ncbi:MAG: amidase [Candidatus Nanopelagicales bacterium]|nr:amidase [Candidatus Nanopelagicales bacterium]MCF8537723.1 amidase [Candidatus Nanopelagicales bacterium]MCF8542777.1 amidase [Candidatus Nanopelagicales bacterium]